MAVGTVVGIHAFDFSERAFEFWKTVGIVCVYLTLATSIGSCASYLVKTRRIMLESSR
jgi:hypothetical protein